MYYKNIKMSLSTKEMVYLMLNRYKSIEAESEIDYKYWYLSNKFHRIGLKTKLDECYVEVLMLLLACALDNKYDAMEPYKLLSSFNRKHMNLDPELSDLDALIETLETMNFHKVESYHTMQAITAYTISDLMRFIEHSLSI